METEENEKDLKKIMETLKSQGCKLKQRVPKTPWIPGGVERMNSLVKALMLGKTLTCIQLYLLIENMMYVINRRPIGSSTTLETVRPADILPVRSKIQLKPSMEVCSEMIEQGRKEFMEKWEVLYKTSILKQQKWFTSNHNLKEGDIVQILDLKGPFNYPI